MSSGGSGLSGFVDPQFGDFSVSPTLASVQQNQMLTNGLWNEAARQVAAGSDALRLSGPGQGAVTSTWGALQQNIEQRQMQSLQQMLERVSTQRSTARGDQEGLMRTDLKDDLERVGRLNVEGLVPALPPGARLEQLINLRLKLLSTLAVVPSVQRQAQAQRLNIETQIRALLREQELNRAALLVRLRNEVPARLESQRGAQIKHALDQVSQSDAQAINAVLQEQQRRVQTDFAAPARLSIPAAPSSHQGLASLPQIGFNKNQFRTFAGSAPSLAPIAPPVLPGSDSQVRRAPVPFVVSGGQGEAASTSGSGSGGQERRWQALLLKRSWAWKVPVR